MGVFPDQCRAFLLQLQTLNEYVGRCYPSVPGSDAQRLYWPEEDVVILCCGICRCKGKGGFFTVDFSLELQNVPVDLLYEAFEDHLHSAHRRLSSHRVQV
jgi:hypothetical protein